MSTSSKTAAGANLHTYAVIRLANLDELVYSLGEQCFDLYLEEFEYRLAKTLRPIDKFTKIAADKYHVALNKVSQHSLVELAAAKLIRELEQPVDIIGDRLKFSFSVGFALPRENCSNKDTLRAAESASKEARRRHKPCLIAGSEDAAFSRPDPHLLPRFEQALERGELVLYYQAKVDAAYNRLVGAEGLVRWHHPEENRVIPPGEFIEAVENSDLIKPMTEYLIRAGIARCVEWAPPLTISINVPPVVLETSDILPVVGDALGFYDLEASRLILEVTERGELPKPALQQLEALRELGTKISIDDFGTGQCSLSYFRDLPADQVKIDSSFVMAMNASHKDRSIVRGCIDLAHHCQMQVVAEGVEDGQTAADLKDMGCDILQGYWIGKPLPFEEFERAHLLGQSAEQEPNMFASLLN